jgi:hypothetical protein
VETYAQPCVYEQQRGDAAAPLPRYRPRQPQATVLHRVVREHLETFLAEGVQRSASGEGYPRYVEKEFRDFVACGDLSRGFARCRCAACGHEVLLPFSCKNRGLCPSCTARRMSDEAAYLVDMVLPEAPYRQWTVTLPFALRLLLARDYKLITAVLGIAVRIIFAWQRRQARREGFGKAKNAAVVFVQRFGGALNSNVHAHALLPDGVFVLDDKSHALRLLRLPPPTDKDIVRLTQRLARRVTALVERRVATREPAEYDPLDAARGEGMPKLASLPEPAEYDPPEATPKRKRRTIRRSAAVDGFGIHADTAVEPHNRLGLEKLCRYGLRPAFSLQRLSLSDDGHVLLALRRPWPRPGGVSVLRFVPVAFLRRLAALIPPPWAHLVRHYGLLAPNAKGRDLLPAAPASSAGLRLETERRAQRAVAPPPPVPSCASAPSVAFAPTPAPGSTPTAPSAPSAAAAPADTATPLRPAQPRPAACRSRRRVLPWAELLRRVFAIDVLRCPSCLGPMTVIAYLTEPAVVDRILTHLGLPSSSPPLAPARHLGQLELFDDAEHLADHRRTPGSLGCRAPPRGLTDCPADDDVDPAADAVDWGA